MKDPVRGFMHRVIRRVYVIPTDTWWWLYGGMIDYRLDDKEKHRLDIAVQVCKPIYLGCRDHEDHSSKPAEPKSL
jgi:hypothetical protein